MNIPEKIKIGGKTYNVEITNNISLGLDCTAEIIYSQQKIKIRPQAREKEETDLLHEMLHGIFDFYGYSEHDEELIDRLANTLHMVIQDNQTIFKT